MFLSLCKSWPVMKRSLCFHLCPYDLVSISVQNYFCPKVGLISQGTCSFLVNLKTQNTWLESVNVFNRPGNSVTQKGNWLNIVL